MTALCLVAWRLLGQIPISDVTSAFITTRLDNLSGVGLFPAIGPNSNPLASYSVGEIGIAPYIEALIVMSLLTLISGRVRDMARNAEGRVTLTRWARALALLLTLGQAYGLTVLYQNTIPPVFGPLDWFTRLAVCLELAGGTALMILLADAMDEFGLGFGNGALIFYVLQDKLADDISLTFCTNDGVEIRAFSSHEQTEEEKKISASGSQEISRTTSNPDVNGRMQVIQKEIQQIKKSSPTVQESTTTVMLPGGNGTLAPSMRTVVDAPVGSRMLLVRWIGVPIAELNGSPLKETTGSRTPATYEAWASPTSIHLAYTSANSFSLPTRLSKVASIFSSTARRLVSRSAFLCSRACCSVSRLPGSARGLT